MRKNTWYEFVRNHNLVNRIYDMLYYFNFFKVKKSSVKEIKTGIKHNLSSFYYVETLAKYFDDKKKKSKKNIELKCNLENLINDLNYLKQYLIRK